MPDFKKKNRHMFIDTIFLKDNNNAELALTLGLLIVELGKAIFTLYPLLY